MPAGRPRKPTAQLKLSGTYREDRHGKNVDVQLENFLSVPVELLPPKTITDSYCQEHYKYHTNLLIKLKILTASDLPESFNCAVGFLGLPAGITPPIFQF